MRVQRTTLGAFPALTAGDGPPLVLLGGLSTQVGVDGPTRRGHLPPIARFATVGTVHFVNRRPGLPRGMTMADLAAELAAAMDDAFGGPVDLAGFSTGGTIAQQVAAEHPDVVRRLVLVSTGCRLSPYTRETQARTARVVRAGGPARSYGDVAAGLVPRGGRRLTAAAAALLGPGRFPRHAALEDLATTIEAEDAFDLAALPTITAPTLLVAGGRDEHYPVPLLEETAALIPNCRFVLLPENDHGSVAVAPALGEALRSFLD
ncbi:alpha/beta fold hydrolase [Patulibacter minatonensis]|uniref:alpha/beta fold hydrolase n=1 Tax=Patulibacter minatonensis TaxID=298163 RepID=UPI00047E8676|nr:alpha/beta hydrolase [Patulibacter minatonensis]